MLEEGRQHQGLDLHKPLKIDPKDPFPIPWQIHEAQTRLLFASILDDFDSRTTVGTVLSQFLYNAFHPDSNEHIAKYEAKLKASGASDVRGDLRSFVNCGISDAILASLDYDSDPGFQYLGEAFEDFFYSLDQDRVCIFKGLDL